MPDGDLHPADDVRSWAHVARCLRRRGRRIATRYQLNSRIRRTRLIDRQASRTIDCSGPFAEERTKCSDSA